MSVIRCRKIGEGRGGGLGANETESEEIYLVQTNNPKDTEQTIFRSGMLPQYGFPHEDNPNIFARTFRAREHKGAYWWKATVGYDNRPLGELPTFAKETQPIPWLRRVKVRGKSVHSKEALKHAPYIDTVTPVAWNNGTGRTIVASADFPLESSSHEAFEGFEKNIDQFVWEVTWNVQTIPFWVANLNNMINNAPVTLLGLTLPAHSLMVRGFAHSDLLEEQLGPYLKYRYYQITFDLHYRRDNWFLGIPDRGFYKIVGGAQKEILLADGSKPVVPVPLDGNGAVLSSPTAATVLFRWYAPYGEASFSDLPIPASVPA